MASPHDEVNNTMKAIILQELGCGCFLKYFLC
jgi:hypothetical protein